MKYIIHLVFTRFSNHSDDSKYDFNRLLRKKSTNCTSRTDLTRNLDSIKSVVLPGIDCLYQDPVGQYGVQERNPE